MENTCCSCKLTGLRRKGLQLQSLWRNTCCNCKLTRLVAQVQARQDRPGPCPKMLCLCLCCVCVFVCALYVCALYVCLCECCVLCVTNLVRAPKWRPKHTRMLCSLTKHGLKTWTTRSPNGPTHLGFVQVCTAF